jgi:hypothetical protein
MLQKINGALKKRNTFSPSCFSFVTNIKIDDRKVKLMFYAHEAFVALVVVVELQLVSPFCVVDVVLAPLTLLLLLFTPLLLSPT